MCVLQFSCRNAAHDPQQRRIARMFSIVAGEGLLQPVCLCVCQFVTLGLCL